MRAQIFAYICLLGLSFSAFTATSAGGIRSSNDQAHLALTSNNSTATTTPSQNSSIPGPNPLLSCGFHHSQTRVVASSPSTSGIKVSVGAPWWLQICTTFGQTSESFVGYEVFPVTVFAIPGTKFVLSVGQASPTPEQIKIGVYASTIWTGFDPVNLTTNSQGIGHSNFTLAGAVMPFVPNAIANVSLPIIARSTSGAQVAAGLPIEFTGGGAAGDLIHVLQAPGPIVFSGTMSGSSGNSIQYTYGVVYAPPASNREAQPIQVTLNVAGSWNNGAVGPLPSGVHITFSQSKFVLNPNQIFYFFVDENNTFAQSSSQSANSFTFAIQEEVGGNSYLEPLSVSVGGGLFGSFGAFPGSSNGSAIGGSENDFYLELGLVAAAAIVALIFGAIILRRRKSSPAGAGLPG